MSKYTILIIIFLILASLLVSFNFVDATSLEGRGGITKQLGEVGFAQAIGLIIKILLGVVGAVALIIFVYGGYLWLASAGIGEKINAGKTVMVWATIGLIIVIFSYTAVDFVIYALVGESEPIAVKPPEEPSPFPTPVLPPACSNQQDDDRDGLTDFPEDPGCEDADDDDEYNPPPPQCSNGIDDDGDNTIDYDPDPNKGDPGCENPQDNDEISQCQIEETQFINLNWNCSEMGFYCEPCPSYPDVKYEHPACKQEAKNIILSNNPGQNIINVVCVGTTGCNTGEICWCYRGQIATGSSQWASKPCEQAIIAGP